MPYFSQDEIEKKEKIRNKFFRDLTSWMGTSVVLLAIDFFLSGGITWSRYPVFFYGIYMVSHVFKYIRAIHFGGDYEDKPSRRKRRRNRDDQPVEDYSDELLNQEDRELADLKEYRQPGKPWKDEDLV